MSASQISHMRLGLERRMRWRCTIQRNTAGKDAYNNTLPPAWNDLTADVPCYVWQGAGKGETQTANILATLDSWNLMVSAGTDVTEADRISLITDAYGDQWNRSTLNIRGVEQRDTHLLIVAEEAK
jgi:hypothetical protein